MKSLLYVILCLLSDHLESRALQAVQLATSVSAEAKYPARGIKSAAPAWCNKRKVPHLQGANSHFIFNVMSFSIM